MPKKSIQPWIKPTLGKNNATATLSVTNAKLIENQRKLDALNNSWGGGDSLVDIQSAITNLTQQLTTLKNDLESEIATVNQSKWVVGEYKWMPVGVAMPTGWTKVNIHPGYALVASDGTKTGDTMGSIKAHNHTVTLTKYFCNNSHTADPNIKSGGNGWDNFDYSPTFTTSTVGGDNNFGAGTYAILWQYTG